MNFKEWLLNETPYISVKNNDFTYKGQPVKIIDFRFEDREETHHLMFSGHPFKITLKDGYLYYRGNKLEKVDIVPTNVEELPEDWMDYAEFLGNDDILLKEPKKLRSTDSRIAV